MRGLYVCETRTVDTDKEIILDAFKMGCYQKMLKDSIDKYNNTNEKLLIKIKKKTKTLA